MKKKFGETELNALLTMAGEKDKMDCISKIHDSSLIKAAQHTFIDSQNIEDSLYLIDPYRLRNKNSVIGTKSVPETCRSELKAKNEVFVYFQERNGRMEMHGVFDKKINQK